MKHLTLLFATVATAFFFMPRLKAQPSATLSGRVVSAASGAPVLYAHIYLPGTSFGTYSDEYGRFVLEARAWGRFELAVSHIEHELTTLPMQAGAERIELGDIRLQSRVYQLEGVAVKADKNWGKYFGIFRREFIGATPNARQCRIANPLVLNFHFDEERNILKAWAYETLIIENQALGYQISYDLVRFEHHLPQGATLFEGAPFFRQATPRNKSQQRRWERNRSEAYQGSIMHFVRSLYHDKLDADGFVLGEPGLMRWVQSEVPVRPELIPTTREQLVQADESEPGAMLLRLPGKMRVIYTAAQAPKAYVAQAGGGTAGHPRSKLSLLADFVRIYPNGYVYNGTDLLLEGFFAWKKMADMLPLEYQAD